MENEEDHVDCIRKTYNSKKQFIKDFVKFCRYQKRQAKRKEMPIFVIRHIVINKENWRFQVKVSANAVYTEAYLFLGDSQACHFPETKWGGLGERWDSALRAFLNREINKEDMKC